MVATPFHFLADMIQVEYNIKGGGVAVKRKYMVRQGLMILNQLLLIVFLCVMNNVGATIPSENSVHIVLLTLLFWDGYYISSKNVKGNPILSQFAILLVLFGWHFGLSLFGSYSLADMASVVILPICLYQLVNFVQAFLFQGANYKGRKVFLSGISILCFVATICFFLDRECFYIIYNIQFLVSFVWCIVISAIHRKRVWFVLKSQRKQLLFSVIGIQPGPMMYISELPTVYKVFAALMLANLAMLVVGCLGVRFFAKIVSVEKKMLYPIILVISLLGAFSINKNVFDVGVCVVFGVIGWLMNKYEFPLSPILLALILGPMCEKNFVRYMNIQRGNFFAIFTSPIAMVFMVVAVGTILFSIYNQSKINKREAAHKAAMKAK